MYNRLEYGYSEGFLRQVYANELIGVREAGVELLVQKLNDGELNDRVQEAIEQLIVEFIEENLDELQEAEDETEEAEDDGS
jgi:DNA-directed RNA polymerase beta' subunit